MLTLLDENHIAADFSSISAGGSRNMAARLQDKRRLSARLGISACRFCALIAAAIFRQFMLAHFA